MDFAVALAFKYAFEAQVESFLIRKGVELDLGHLFIFIHTEWELYQVAQIGIAFGRASCLRMGPVGPF